jgi:TetR/AcrR family transcriptional regulator, regulator of cefoperazone and chloramphenicol sensitivity
MPDDPPIAMPLPSRPADPRTAETRQRIMETSIRLFGEHGFKGVSVRDISAAAGVNIAAVSYHFGSKQGLYRTLFETVMDEDEDRFREQMANVATLLGRAGADRALLAAAVEILVGGMVGRIATYEHTHWFSVLLARELALPGELFELLYRRRAEPIMALMTRVVTAALGLPQGEPSGRLAANVLYGQVANLVFSRPVLWRQMGWDRYGAERVELLTQTVSDLVCRALGLQPGGAAPPVETSVAAQVGAAP